MLDTSTAVGIEVAPKRSVLETSRLELSEDVSFDIETLVVIEKSSLENAPGGCDIHRRIRYMRHRCGTTPVWHDTGVLYKHDTGVLYKPYIRNRVTFATLTLDRKGTVLSRV